MYGCYIVYMKHTFPDESRVDMPLFFGTRMQIIPVPLTDSCTGFVGLFNLILLMPGFRILDETGWEPFGALTSWRMPCAPHSSKVIPTGFPDKTTWGYVILNCLVGTVISDYLWLWATLLTSPLITTLGSSALQHFCAVSLITPQA